MIKRFFSIFCIASNFVCLYSQASLEIVRGDGDWNPLEWEIDGYFYGFHVELIQEAADLADLEISFTSYPWARAISSVKNDNADAIMYVSRNEERENFLYYDERNVISEVSFIILVRNDSNIEYNGSLSALSGSRIGITRGFVYGKSYEQYSDSFLITESKSLELSIRMLNSGRVDAVLSSRIDIKNDVKDRELMNHVRILEPSYETDLVYLAFNRKRVSTDIIEKFSQAISQVKESDFYKRLLEKYRL